MNYIFDVDGTLTDSRQRIDPEFEEFFLDFIKKHRCYTATGSDYDKTLEQLGEDICNNLTHMFQCAGNSVYKKGKVVFETNWQLPEKAELWLLDKLHSSAFYRKTGRHVEKRPGMVNFSIVGRNCNFEERVMYKEWDEHKNERNNIAEAFMDKFNLQADVAGETGIDIYPIGADKSQVINWIELPITFFGDKTHEGGNDYPLAKALENCTGCKTVAVNSWQDTYRCLQSL
jgi:phosphomannomutase|tara:strand:- start:889 stop:1578 length:690 start_codon:yes stop_codon:yes gene_type:complete